MSKLSPSWYPTPRGGTVPSWENSYKKARKLVERMTLVEKVNITTGVGWQMGLCVGNTGKHIITETIPEELNIYLVCADIPRPCTFCRIPLVMSARRASGSPIH